jgi:protein-tyrosine phosphatase
MEWVIEKHLARTSRPGYPMKHGIEFEQVEEWISEAREIGIKTIICLLADQQLAFYDHLDGGLLELYRSDGFDVVHIPVEDHLDPPVDPKSLKMAVTAYRSSTHPVLVHCSAGMDRTGAVASAIQEEIEARS